MTPTAPPYGESTLAEVLPSVAATLGVPGVADALGLSWNDDGSARDDTAAVVLLVDGLGLRQLIDNSQMAPTLASLAAPSGVDGGLSSPFPSTTAVSLTSLGTGLAPGGHGVVGTAYRLPGESRVLHPLQWQADPDPLLTQPHATVLERAAAAGVTVTRVAPRGFEGTGLTRAALRGGAYRGADTVGERVGGVREALSTADRALVYAYWPDLDKVGHLRGVDSPDWRAELAHVDLLVAQLIDLLRPGQTLWVTSDHGMLDTAPGDRIDVDADPDLTRDVVAVAGEPRVRHVYAAAGSAADVLRRWRDRLGDRAWVADRDEVVAAGLIGPVDDPGASASLGDVVAVATGTTVLASPRTDAIISSLTGQHGGLTTAETSIPLLVARG